MRVLAGVVMIGLTVHFAAVSILRVYAVSTCIGSLSRNTIAKAVARFHHLLAVKPCPVVVRRSHLVLFVGTVVMVQQVLGGCCLLLLNNGNAMVLMITIIVIIVIMAVVLGEWNLRYCLDLTVIIIVVIITNFQVVWLNRDSIRKVESTFIGGWKNALSALANYVGTIRNASTIKAACSITTANVTNIISVRSKGNTFAVQTSGAVTIANVTDIVGCFALWPTEAVIATCSITTTNTA
jgi:hypothetical protein